MSTRQPIDFTGVFDPHAPKPASKPAKPPQPEPVAEAVPEAEPETTPAPTPTIAAGVSIAFGAVAIVCGALGVLISLDGEYSAVGSLTLIGVGVGLSILGQLIDIKHYIRVIAERQP